MKNMKKLLGALTALSFVTVAGVSTVACGPNEVAPAKLDAQVLADLGLTNENGSTLELSFINVENEFQWDVAALTDLNASQLLKADGTAKSDEAKTLLTSVLKLTAEEDKFNAEEAAKINLKVVKITPTLVNLDDKSDFAVSEGTVTAQWKNEEKTFGSQYTLDLKADKDKGIVGAALPTADDGKITLDIFDATQAPLDKFVIGEKVADVSEGEITNLLKADDEVVKELKALSEFVGKDQKGLETNLMMTITAVNAKGEEFAEGDTLTVKINFGKNTQFSTEYTLKVQAADETPEN